MDPRPNQHQLRFLRKESKQRKLLFFSPYRLLTVSIITEHLWDVKEDLQMVTRTGIEPMFAA